MTGILYVDPPSLCSISAPSPPAALVLPASPPPFPQLPEGPATWRFSAVFPEILHVLPMGGGTLSSCLLLGEGSLSRARLPSGPPSLLFLTLRLPAQDVLRTLA